MTREKAIGIVQAAILEQENIEPSKYDLATTFDSLKIDSLSKVQILIIIEEEISPDDMKVQFSANEFNTLKVIEDLVKLVERYD
jgi:acyl carrier protein